MKFFKVEVEATVPASQTVMVWAKDADEAQEKALAGRTLEDGDVVADDYLFDPEHVIDCEEVPEDEVDEEIVLQAREEAKKQAAEEVAVD